MKVCSRCGAITTASNDEIERLRTALDTLRGRYRLYAGWPDFKWAGHTDIEVLKMADEALGDKEGRLMDDNRDGYLGLYRGGIDVGMTFIWEPNKPHARQVVTVIRVTEPDHDERKIWTSEDVWNDESRFREAVVDVSDIIESKEGS